MVNQELERRREKEYIDNWAKGNDVINPGALDTKNDGDVKVNNKDLAGTNVGTNVIAKAETAKKTKRLPKPFRLRMPKIPGTPHNVGRRVNPQ